MNFILSLLVATLVAGIMAVIGIEMSGVTFLIFIVSGGASYFYFKKKQIDKKIKGWFNQLPKSQKALAVLGFVIVLIIFFSLAPETTGTTTLNLNSLKLGKVSFSLQTEIATGVNLVSSNHVHVMCNSKCDKHYSSAIYQGNGKFKYIYIFGDRQEEYYIEYLGGYTTDKSSWKLLDYVHN